MEDVQSHLLKLSAELAAQRAALGFIVRSLSRDPKTRDSLQRAISDLETEGKGRSEAMTSSDLGDYLAQEAKAQFKALAEHLKRAAAS